MKENFFTTLYILKTLTMLGMDLFYYILDLKWVSFLAEGWEKLILLPSWSFCGTEYGNLNSKDCLQVNLPSVSSKWQMPSFRARCATIERSSFRRRNCCMCPCCGGRVRSWCWRGSGSRSASWRTRSRRWRPRPPTELLSCSAPASIFVEIIQWMLDKSSSDT